MKKLLILLSFLAYSCSAEKGIDPSCGLGFFYDEVNKQCLEFCTSESEDIKLAYEFNSITNEYVCSICDKDNQYIANGLCLTCNFNQVKVNDGNNNFFCKNISPCNTDMDCDKSNNLVCNQSLGYCVNCTADENCGVGRYCNITQLDGTCLLKKPIGKNCEYNNECNSGKCTIDKTCACQTDNECVLFGISIDENYTTCNIETGLCD